MQNLRPGTGPALTKGEWECLATPPTWSEYRTAENATVCLWKIHQKFTDEPGRNGIKNKVERGRESLAKSRIVGR